MYMMAASGLLLKPLWMHHSLNYLKWTKTSPLLMGNYLMFERQKSKKSHKKKKHQRFKDDKAARTFVVSLDEKSRRMIFQELKTYEEENISKPVENLAEENASGSLSRSNVWNIVIFNALPFIAFGFFDNFIMIVAGNYIDTAFGGFLGISTLAAAGLGNLVSDVAGVATTGYIESMILKIGLSVPSLSEEQAQSWGAHVTTGIGRIIGISLGCLIGMFPLLMVNYDEKPKKRRKRKEEYKQDQTTDK